MLRYRTWGLRRLALSSGSYGSRSPGVAIDEDQYRGHNGPHDRVGGGLTGEVFAGDSQVIEPDGPFGGVKDDGDQHAAAGSVEQLAVDKCDDEGGR